MNQEDKNYIRRKRIVSGVSIVVLLALLVVIGLVVGKPLLAMAKEPELFRQWVNHYGAWSRVIMVAVVALQVVVALIPGEPIEIGAGYAFGAVEGTLLCLLGMVIGTCVIFGFTRLLGVKMVEAFISREKLQSLKFLQNNKRLNLLVTIIFLIPGTPKDLITYFIGLTPMKLWVFLLISTLARLPSVVSSTIGGGAIGEENYTLAIVVFAVTGLLAIGGIIWYRKLAKSEG